MTNKWPRNRYTGVGGGLCTGVVGGLYTEPEGGLFTGTDTEPYMSNWPPPRVLIEELQKRGITSFIEIMLNHGF